MVEPYHVWTWLPEGTVGDWSIRRCRLFCGGDFVTELWHGTNRWMSDNDLDMREHAEFVKQAHGDVLVTGLGIGFLPCLLLQADRCKSITVIEQSAEVEQLVLPHLKKRFVGKGAQLKAIRADANTFIPKQKYDFGWADHYAIYPSNEERALIRRLWCERVNNIHFWSHVPT